MGRIAAQAPPTKGANFLDHVPNAQQGETLRYRVRAHNESGDSGYSQELSLRVAAAAMPNPVRPPTAMPRTGMRGEARK